jgi:small subunit ribosomal protein S1
MSSIPNSPLTTAAANPLKAGTPAGPAHVHADEAPHVSDEMNAEMEAAMRGAVSSPAAPPGRGPSPDAHRSSPGVRPAAIRGPRVVQGGREHRTGKVVSVGPSDVFVEFGPKELGVVPRLQWPEGDEPPKKDEALEVVVDRFEASEGLFICSRPGTVRKADWELLEPGQTIEARVTGVNKGGLELEAAGHAAFMPAGQVSVDRIADLSALIGEKLTCVVQRVDRRGRGNIILSRRDVLAQEKKDRAAKLKETLQEGQTVEGIVRKIMPFGAFVDLGGVDGLVHLGDLSHERVGHGERSVGRFVKEGDKVRVQILKLDWEADRISLGMKQIQSDPFAMATNEVAEGAEISGRVTKIMEFGAFVEVSPGVEGLVHISELAWRRVGKVEEVLKQDEIIRAKVLKIDRESRRISLSVKALLSPPEPVAPPEGAGRAQGGPGGGGGGGYGGGRGGSSGGRAGGSGGGRFGKGREVQGRSLEEIQKDTPALRRLREKFGKQGFKGGIA